MIDDFLIREEGILGEKGIEILKKSHVLVVGLGGVGSYALEALVRGGIGKITIADGDVVQVSNLNRQLCALRSTVGMNKAQVLKARVMDINPACEIKSLPIFYNVESKKNFDFGSYDYIIDAIDSVKDKVDLIVTAREYGVQIISAMGAGNKANPTMFQVADISKTEVCPLAKVMRRELRQRGINHLTVVYSKEEPFAKAEEGGKRVTGSLSFVPGVMGLIMAGEVIKDLVKEGNND